MITGLLGRLGVWLGVALAAVAGIFAVWRSGKSVGTSSQAEADNNAAATRTVNEVSAAAATEVQTLKDANDVLTDVNKLPDGSATSELRDKWQRD